MKLQTISRNPIRYIILIWNDNINRLLIPSSRPRRLHERKLHICKDTCKKNIFLICGHICNVCFFPKQCRIKEVCCKAGNYAWDVVAWHHGPLSHFACHDSLSGLHHPWLLGSRVIKNCWATWWTFVAALLVALGTAWDWWQPDCHLEKISRSRSLQWREARFHTIEGHFTHETESPWP